MWKLALVTSPEILAQEAGSLVPAKLPVDIESIIRVMAIEIVPYDFPESISGVYNEIAGQPYIGINHNHSALRRRFSVAHELYHFFTDLDCGEIAAMISKPSGMRVIEANANRFAALLLMPEEPLRILWAKGVCQKHLAETFGVSEQAMQIRLKDLGLKTKSSHFMMGSHTKGDCCELAGIQRVARQPYIQSNLSSWVDSVMMVLEDGQPMLPMVLTDGLLARTVEGVVEDVYKAERRE